VKDVQVADADLSKTMVVGDAHTSITIEDAEGNTFTMFSSRYSDFKDSQVPQGSGVLKGVASINNSIYQMLPQSAADFAGMTGTRFDTPDGPHTYISISDLRAKGVGEVTDDVWVKGIVVSASNSSSLKNVTINDNGGGIMVRFVNDASFATGEEIEVKVKGVALSEYNGLLQLNNTPNANAASLSTGNTLPYTTITVAQLLAGTYESRYVGVQNVQVASADLSKTVGLSTGDSNIGIENEAGDTFSMLTTRYASFIADNVPQGSGTLKGIASENTANAISTIQVMPQASTDYSGMTGARYGNDPITYSLSFSGTLEAGAAASGATITLSYYNAKGEAYNYSVAVTGVTGLSVASKSGNFATGTGSVVFDVTGTPAAAGTATFTLSGTPDLGSTNTVNATVTAAGGPNYDSNFGKMTSTLSGTYSGGPESVTIGGTEYYASKLGSGSKLGKYTTEVVPITGDAILTFYGVGWNTEAAGTDVKITVNNGGLIDGATSKTIRVVANEGFKSNKPYPVVVAASDFYTCLLSGVTAETTLTIETDNSVNTSCRRALLFGMNIN
jgi:hypothetical protein